MEEKKAEASGRMAVDYSFHALLAGNPPFEVLEEIGDVIRGGIPTIKTLTTYGWMSDDGHRYGVMSEVAEHGGLSIVHAEDDDIANWLTKKHLREGKTHGAYIVDTRGPLVEEAAVRRCLLLAERTGSPSTCSTSQQAARRSRSARDAPAGCPSSARRSSPTSRSRPTSSGTTRVAGCSGTTIRSSHQWTRTSSGRRSPTTVSRSSARITTSAADRFEKMGTTVDRFQAGQASVEMRVPVLFHRGVHERRISLNRFVELVSTNPAKIMGLYPRKGALAVGSDADIVVIDPAKSWTVSAESHHMSPDYNCWEGWKLQGRVTTTILRGSVLVADGNWVGSRTGGRFIERTLLPELTGRPPDLSLTSERRSRGPRSSAAADRGSRSFAAAPARRR